MIADANHLNSELREGAPCPKTGGMGFIHLFLTLCLSAAAAFGADISGKPLPRAHAHNDYEHTRPLWDALAQGFCSVEADIHLVDGKLLVAHDAKDVNAEKTLEKLYLEPLRQLAQKNGGRVYPGGPDLTLLVDIKTEATPTYRALEPVLRRYESILTRFRDEKIETNAVTVILSGNRPKQILINQPDRFAAFDGRLADLGYDLPISFMPLVSDNFAERFPSAKTGILSSADRIEFIKAVKKAHAEGRKIRFWATHDNAATWALLAETGVDLINTDDLAGLATFLRNLDSKR